MPQLFGRDLRSGDILLEVNGGTFTQQAIRFGQKMMGRGTEEIIHAGILFDNRYVIESDKHGITANDIYLQDKPYSFLVFRPTNTALAAGAATCAKIFLDIHARTGGLPYSVSGAVASIFKGPGIAPTPNQIESTFNEMMKGKNHPFFCSQFVVFVFQFVAEQNNIAAGKIFPFTDACVPPSALAASLKRHPMFQEAGYLMENQR
jgi:hypothetical protein